MLLLFKHNGNVYSVQTVKRNWWLGDILFYNRNHLNKH